MNILVAPNAFKGSLSAVDAAHVIAETLQTFGISADIMINPIADGGDGTLQVLKEPLNCELITKKVRDPIGRTIEASYGYSVKNSLAVIEMAEASGIRNLASNELDPWMANTYGTGELILDALSRDVTQVYLSVGGSATIDAGVGILEALGMIFLDSEGRQLTHLTPGSFEKIRILNSEKIEQLIQGVEFTILCDVINPIIGEQGSVRVFGPQKGLKVEDTLKMEMAVEHWVELIERHYDVEIRKLKSGGAAGGIPATLFATMNADLIDGADKILELVGFNSNLEKADLVITGEGKLDRQTIFGKGPGVVAQFAKAAGKKTIGFCGIKEAELNVTDSPFDEIFEINEANETLIESLENTEGNLRAAVIRFCKTLR